MSMLPADTHRRLEPPCPACNDTGDIHSETGEWRSICTICPAGGAPRHPAAVIVKARAIEAMNFDLGAIVRQWARTPGALIHPDLRSRYVDS